MEHNFEKAKNVKLLLTVFEHLFVLKINFHKSELYYYGEAKEAQHEYRNIFGCPIGEAAFRYLSIPIHHTRIRNKDWNVIKEGFKRKLSTWKSKMLSYGGRFTLINWVLSNLSMYMISFFEISKEVLKKLDYFMPRFFWQGDGYKRKYISTK
jgi:hypothetical protein